jgi:virginiamycin B lyase
MVFALVAGAVLTFAFPGIAQSPSRPHFLKSYVLPLGAYPSSIVTGSDGALWFSTYPYFTNHSPIDLGVGRITTDGVLSFVLIGKGTYDVAPGPDGRIWFTNPYKRPYDIGAVSTTGVVVHYPVPGHGLPESIASGPYRHLWITSFGGNPDILQFDTGGKLDATYHSIGSAAVKIALGSDNHMWFDGAGNPNLVGTIRPPKELIEKQIGGPSYVPGPIAAGPDGRVWICDGNFVAAVTRDFDVVRYPMPYSDSGSTAIAAGPDGNLWVTDFTHGSLVRVTTAGRMTEFKIPILSAWPDSITVGPDGNLWYTEIQPSDTATIGSFAP